MINCREKWGSVRKVRYLGDIEVAVRYMHACMHFKLEKPLLSSSVILQNLMITPSESKIY